MPKRLMDSEKKPDLLKGHYSFKQRKIIGKVMYEFGWGSTQLGKWLNMKSDTIRRAADLPTPEALVAFEESFRLAMRDMDMIGLFETKKRIRQLIPREKDIIKLVKAGEFFGGETIKKQTNTQVNVYSDLLGKYGEGVETVPVKVVEAQVVDTEGEVKETVKRTLKK